MEILNAKICISINNRRGALLYNNQQKSMDEIEKNHKESVHIRNIDYGSYNISFKTLNI